MPLTPKHQRFVNEYLIDLNATRAYVAAGYSKIGATAGASRLLANKNIKAVINKKKEKLANKLEISSERVLSELAKVAFHDTRKFFNLDGSPKDITDLDDDSASAIAGFEAVELFDGSQGDQKHVAGLVKKIKTADRLRALELIGKHLKLFTDKSELSGPDGGPVPVSVVVDL